MPNIHNLEHRTDKDARNRRDILKNGLRLPYNKNDVITEEDEYKTFFVDVNSDYINTLKKRVVK
jgi:hypothetical protein